MALSGLEIYKKLPKTNCSKCGFPTCLAFAMQLAAGKVELDKCPDVSEEGKAALGEAATPPIMPVIIGNGENALKIGEEMVLYRHEKRFEHPTVLAVELKDDDEGAPDTIKRIGEWSVERVGQTLSIDMLALRNSSGDTGSFMKLVGAADELAAKSLMLISDDKAALKQACGKVASKRPLLCPSGIDGNEAVSEVAKEFSLPFVVRGKGIEDVIKATEAFASTGFKEMVIDTSPGDIRAALEDSVAIRRSALKKGFKPLGHPVMTFAADISDDALSEVMAASTMMMKYSALIVLSSFDPATALPLLVLRQNIFTDPQRPMQMEQGIYPLNNPDGDSPLLVTTNFSLTYFTVSNEIEASRVPSWLLVMDTEGLSVLTAWSAGKFVADAIAQFIKKSGVEEKLNHKRLIIPGYVSQLSGELEEELGGWDITVGVREAGDIPAFLRSLDKV